MKLCCDCWNARHVTNLDGEPTPLSQGFPAWCLAPQVAESVDYLWGGVAVASVLCRDARSDYKKCGHEGRYWRPRGGQ